MKRLASFTSLVVFLAIIVLAEIFLWIFSVVAIEQLVLLLLAQVWTLVLVLWLDTRQRRMQANLLQRFRDVSRAQKKLTQEVSSYARAHPARSAGEGHSFETRRQVSALFRAVDDLDHIRNSLTEIRDHIGLSEQFLGGSLGSHKEPGQ